MTSRLSLTANLQHQHKSVEDIDVMTNELYATLNSDLHLDFFYIALDENLPCRPLWLWRLQLPRTSPRARVMVATIAASSQPSPIDGVPNVFDSRYASIAHNREPITDLVTGPAGVMAITLGVCSTAGIEDVQSLVFMVHLGGVHAIVTSRLFEALTNIRYKAPDWVWSRWGPNISRLLSNPYCNDYSLSLHGYRTLEARPLASQLVWPYLAAQPSFVASSLRDVFYMRDFSPETLSLHTSGLPANTTWFNPPGEVAAVRVTRQPSIFRTSDFNVFAENVVSRLPYCEVISTPVKAISEVLFDGHHFYTLKVCWVPYCTLHVENQS